MEFGSIQFHFSEATSKRIFARLSAAPTFSEIRSIVLALVKEDETNKAQALARSKEKGNT